MATTTYTTLSPSHHAVLPIVSLVVGVGAVVLSVVAITSDDVATGNAVTPAVQDVGIDESPPAPANDPAPAPAAANLDAATKSLPVNPGECGLAQVGAVTRC